MCGDYVWCVCVDIEVCGDCVVWIMRGENTNRNCVWHVEAVTTKTCRKIASLYGDCIRLMLRCVEKGVSDN